MEVEKKFNAAVNVIQNLPKDGSFQPSNEMKLKFYAHYKQATQGPCRQSRPGFFDVIGRAKHDAWASLGDMEKEAAMNGYVEALTQIIETMNFNTDVETFMETLGPFYEYIEDRLSPELRIKNAKNLGEITGKAPSSTPEDDESFSSSADDDELDEDESEVSLEGMLGQFNTAEGFNYNSVKPDQHFIEDMKRPSKEVKGTFAKSYIQEDKLSNTLGTKKIDLNHNTFNLQDDRFISELRATESSIENTKTLLEDIHRMKNNFYQCKDNKTRYFTDDNEEENIVNVSNELSKQQIDRMLDRYDGHVPPTTADAIEDIPEQDMNDDSDSEIFEDSVDFTEMVAKKKKYENELDERRPSMDSHYLQLSSEKHDILRAPAHGRKLSGALRKELEDDQILIVSSHSKPETILMSNVSSTDPDQSIERFMEGVVAQLNIDLQRVNSNLNHVSSGLDHLSIGMDHLTARMSSLETNFQQMNSRINTIEYLLKVLLSREESWFDRKVPGFVLPFLGAAFLLMTKVLYDRRR